MQLETKKRKYILTKLMNGSSTYIGRFPVDGREIALCDNPKRVVIGPMDKPENKEVRYNFSKDYPFHSIEIDMSKRSEVEFLEHLQKDSRVFFKGGNKQISSGCIYELIDVEGEEINTANEIKKRGKLQSVIYSMPKDELVKLCYYFNINIAGKSVEGIYVLLLHWETGALYRPMNIGGKNVVPMDLVLNNGMGAEFEVRTAVNKGIITGVIKNRGGVYFLGESGTPIGQTPEQIYSYMEQNKMIFEGSLKNLLKNEELPESLDYSGTLDDAQKSYTDAIVKKDETYTPFKGRFTPFERQEYEKEAQQLGIQGHIAAFKDETLYAKVIEKRQHLSAKG